MNARPDRGAPTPPAIAPAAAPAPDVGGGLVGFRGAVTFTDGRPPALFEAGPAVLASWELYAMRNGYPVRADEAPPMLMSVFVAFTALGLGPEGFDTWRREVYGVELVPFDVPPTLPAPSAA